MGAVYAISLPIMCAASVATLGGIACTVIPLCSLRKEARTKYGIMVFSKVINHWNICNIFVF